MTLQTKANEIRSTLFDTLYHAGGGHFGGCLSVVETLTALYYGVMKYNPKFPDDPQRDRLVLSKGHAGPALYVVLADVGFFEKERLAEVDQNGGRLPKHIDRLKVPGVEFSTGPLGQGVSAAAGMALGLKSRNSSARVFAITGDGECDEGQVWETAMMAAHYHLDNFIVIVDLNGCQVDGNTEDVMNLGNLAMKWEAFGWNVLNAEGNDADDMLHALNEAAGLKNTKPTVILAKTLKGKGIPFMEGNYRWHSGSVTDEQYLEGRAALDSIGK